MLFKNRFRARSNRLHGWDYGAVGWYFVTICTLEKICWFGDIDNGEMLLSWMGEVVQQCWREIPLHLKNISLDQFVVMPNHLHGIVVVRSCRDVARNVSGLERRVDGDVACNVSTGQIKSMSSISPRKGSLSVAIRSFKSACTKRIRETDQSFAWQRNYHDRIIRNEAELNAIREYIRNNPLKWDLDRENPVNR